MVTVTRRLFGTLCGLVFLVNLGRVGFAPLVPTISAEFAASTAVVGTVTTLVWIGSALPRIPLGYVLTKVPRHYVVLGSGVALAAAAFYTGTAETIRQLQAGALFLGLSSGAYYVAAVPLIAELFPAARGRAIGVHGTASQLAAVVAPGVVFAVLVVSGWNTVFHLLGAGALVVTVLLYAVVRRNPLPEAAGPDRNFRSALSFWPVILVGVAIVATPGFVWQGVFNFYVTYLVGTKGLSPTHANGLLTIVFAAGVPAFWYSGRLADRLPHVPYLLAIMVSFAVALFTLVVADGLVSLVIVTALLGVVVHALFPAIDTFMLESLPADNRASVYAVFSGVALFLEATGSGVIGFTAERTSFDVAFGMGAIGVLGVAVLIWGLYTLGRLPGSHRRP